MIPVEQETDLEVLRQYAILYRDAAEGLARENAKLKGEKESQSQDFLHAKLKDQLTRLRKKFFGFGREKRDPNRPRPVGHKQQELRLHGKRAHVETTKSERKTGKPEKDHHKVGERIEHDFSPDRLREENRVREIAVHDSQDPKEA